jgi:hypothetical protein
MVGGLGLGGIELGPKPFHLGAGFDRWFVRGLAR